MTTSLPPLPDCGPLELFDPTTASLADNRVVARFPIGDSLLHIELVEVELDDTGRLAKVIDPALRELAWSVLDLNHNPDPQTLSWAGRHWLVMTDPYMR